MIGLFRLIALAEGVTTVTLFLVAMPLKYMFDQPQFVPPVGLAHGIAFIAYMAAMWALLRNQGFTQADWTRTALPAFYPFGTFINDGFLRRRQLELAAQRP